MISFNEQDIFRLTGLGKNDYLPLNDTFNLETHLAYPIADIPVDPDKMTLTNLLDDGTIYSFPHVYFRLSPGYSQRLVPLTAHKNLGQFEQSGQLKFDVRFTQGNTIDVPNTKLMVYALYDDVHATFDPKQKRYNSVYTAHKV
jgi:hypothetical protein